MALSVTGMPSRSPPALAVMDHPKIALAADASFGARRQAVAELIGLCTLVFTKFVVVTRRIRCSQAGAAGNHSHPSGSAADGVPLSAA